MQTFLIVGKNFSGLRSKILSNGDEYILLQDIQTTKSPNKQLKRRVLADFSSKKSILQAAEQFKGKVNGVVCCLYENYIVPSAWIAEHLDLPGLSPESAELCTDKYLMRQAFARSPQPISPAFAEIHNQAELLAFAKNHPYPLILKPANLVKSLLITKSSNRRELLDNYQRATQQIEALYQRYAPHRAPKLLVEEFMEGSVHSVEAFVDTKGTPNILEQIVDYQTGYDVGFDDNFHYSRILPSKLSPKDQQQLRRCAEMGIRALGMKSSPAHVEIIMTTAGPRIVEIGARNGGYRDRMHGLANGIGILDNTLKLSLGRPPMIQATKDEPCAVLELFPKQAGTFTQLSHANQVNELKSLVYLAVKAKSGQHIGKSSEGHKAAAIIILHNSNTAQFNRDLSYVNDCVRVKTA